MIRFAQVGFSIDGSRILTDLSFEVAEGETLVLVGRSGSGKTTALRMVNAMRVPTAGVVEVDGRDTRGWDAVALRRGIGYVIQEVGLFPHCTVEENVGTVPRLLGWDAERTRIRSMELLGEVGLEPERFAMRYPAELSGGQRQRVGIARALAAEPRILLFDEPFGALDPITRREMQDLFLRLRERYGATSLFVTHDLGEAMRLGTRIGVLRDGRLETLGTPREFRAAKGGEAQRFLATLPDGANLGMA